MISTSCPQFDCSQIDSPSLECNIEKSRDDGARFDHERPNLSELTEAEKEDIKSQLEAKKEERRQNLLRCACCSEEVDVDELIDGLLGEGDPSSSMEGYGHGGNMFGKPSNGMEGGRFGLGTDGQGGRGDAGFQGSFSPGSGQQGSGRPQGSGMGGQGGRPQGSGRPGMGMGGSVQQGGSGRPGMGGGGSQGGSSTGRPGQGSGQPGSQGGTGGTVDCSGVKLVKTVSGQSATCDGFDDEDAPFHLWPVGVPGDYCHGWSGIASRDDREHINSANNLRCSADGTKLLYTQYAGSIDCTSVMNPNGVEKEFVLGECHQGFPPTLYDMGTNMDCCLDPFGENCMNDFTGTPAVPENAGVTDVAIWLNGEKCDLSESELENSGHDALNLMDFAPRGFDIHDEEATIDNPASRRSIALGALAIAGGIVSAVI